MEEEVSFEEALERLKTSVSKLDDGELTLEQMVAVYEEGTLMAKRCQEVLDQAKGRILKIQERDGKVDETELE